MIVYEKNRKNMVEKFKALGLSEELCLAVRDLGFKDPSEVQERAIPFILDGKNVVAGSKTGSGKTLAFGAGMIDNSVKGEGIQALVLTPTRELAEQVMESIKTYSKYKKLGVCSVYGGVSMNPQISNLKRSEIVVATPGRLLDHIRQGTIKLGNVKIAALDEADIMFDMGFIDDVSSILDECKNRTQTLLFSATITEAVHKIVTRYIKNYEEVAVESYVDSSKLTQIYYDTDDRLKFSLLVHLLREEKGELVMIFCNSRRNVDFVANNLKELGMKAAAIHGGLTQNRRQRMLERFSDEKSKVGILVCTDVAARGIHVDSVSHVFNYDIPNDSKQYVHRIGRTARAGEEGMAINILTARDHENFQKVLRDNDVEIDFRKTPEVERIRIAWKEDRGSRGFGGRNSRNGRGGPRRGGSGGRSGGYSSGGRSGGSSGRSSGGPRRSNSSGPRSGRPGANRGKGPRTRTSRENPYVASN